MLRKTSKNKQARVLRVLRVLRVFITVLLLLVFFVVVVGQQVPFLNPPFDVALSVFFCYFYLLMKSF